jgi:hypothetical protein
MSWNHKTRVVAMAIAIQPVAGVFTAPAEADLVAVSVPNNSFEPITADDPTATGAIWTAPQINLGRTGTAGASFVMRGPGGAAPPAANGWPEGRILQAAGWTELINATERTGVTVAGSTTSAIALATTESAVDDFLIGVPLQMSQLGTGFRKTVLISDYVGSSKMATIPQTLGAAPAAGANYTIPPYLLYRLGTLTGTPPPMLSISIWRDKKRYDYKDWRPTSLTINMPVTNDANTEMPSIEFTGRATPEAEVDVATTPVLPDAKLQLPVAPVRGGKFYVDRTMLGHQSLSFGETLEVAAPSNQNQDAGQDAYELMSGSRTVDLDFNQMSVTDFDIKARADNQTVMPFLSTWGLGAGNRWGFLLPAAKLTNYSPGDRNGFVNLTGNAEVMAVDKSACLCLWWGT